MLTNVHIVIPVYDDWGSVAPLLSRIGKTLAVPPAVLLVDDGSSAPVPADLGQGLRSLIRSVEVLHLRRNLGHQRAIAVGLMHLLLNARGDAVVVMDADGEDLPEHVAVLLDLLRQTGQPAVFAAAAWRERSSGSSMRCICWPTASWSGGMSAWAISAHSDGTFSELLASRRNFGTTMPRPCAGPVRRSVRLRFPAGGGCWARPG